MRSHELAKLLLERPDVQLICQRDSEGNGYEPLRGVDFDVIYVDDFGDCEVYSTNDSASDNCMEEDEWERLKKEYSGRFAVLFP